MRVLFVPNWRVHAVAGDRQPPDYAVPGQPYWFFRHFSRPVEVDVVDVARWPWYGLEDRFLHFYAAQGLACLLRARRHDVVLVHGAQSAVTLLAAVRALRLQLPPVVVIDVGAFNQGRPEAAFSFSLVRWALGAASKVIWHSRGGQEMARRWAPEIARTGEFIRFGTNAGQWPAEQGDGEYALCTGYAKRDYTLLQTAWRSLSDAPLVVLGISPGEVPGLDATCLGRLPFREYQRVVSRARVVVHPLSDSWASLGQMTLLDAFAASRPVVVSDVAPVRDYVGDWCVTVPEDDPEALADGVRTLWEDSALRRDLGARARSAVEGRLSEKEMALRIETVLARCLEPASRSSALREGHPS